MRAIIHHWDYNSNLSVGVNVSELRAARSGIVVCKLEDHRDRAVGPKVVLKYDASLPSGLQVTRFPSRGCLDDAARIEVVLSPREWQKVESGGAYQSCGPLEVSIDYE